MATHYISPKSVLSGDIHGEKILLTEGTGLYYGLNPVASHVWSMLQDGATLEDLVQRTCERFNVSPDQCEADIRQLLLDLEGEQLVSAVEVQGHDDGVVPGES